MVKVFIDGSEGTTGLRIHDRLASRDDIELLTIDESLRKDENEKRRMYSAADFVFLCLPDEAARRAVVLAEGCGARIIDTSTAHRVEKDFSYGFCELSKRHRQEIVNGDRVAVPGCHASGFIAIVYPLVASGMIDAGAQLSCFSITGYSGGGKKMIAQYQSAGRPAEFNSPRIYGLTQQHKHLKEMQSVCGINTPPVFSPIVCDFYSGMAVTVPFTGLCVEDVKRLYEKWYGLQKLISVENLADGEMIAASTMSGKDSMKILVYGNDQRLTVTALFDNLGKGASGAALQCLNLMMGADETKGLIL